MKTTFKIIVGALLLAGLFFSTALGASTNAQGGLPFADYDANQDGVISQEEFAAIRSQQLEKKKNRGQQRWSKHYSTKHKGSCQKKNQTQEGEGWGVVMGYRGCGGCAMSHSKSGKRGHRPAFTAFDLDSNGAITETEFYQARERRIAERAKEGRMMQGLLYAPPFPVLDLNQDGRLTPDEFPPGSVNHHRLGQ